MNFATRQALYRQIEAERNTKVISFITGSRPGLETSIAHDVIELFVTLLDDIGPTSKITLILNTNGGSVATAWRLINLFHTFCETLEIIIPSEAMSAGTLMALGANTIIMTKQAALGPIDPSVNHALGPHIETPSGPVRVPVSAEAVHGYLDEVKKDVPEAAGMAAVWTNLASHINPVVLGEVFRRRAQIRFLAAKLIENSVAAADKRQPIIDLLCSESGSHDYTINRREAKALGLNVEVPSDGLYGSVSAIARSYMGELKVLEPYSPTVMLGTNPTASYTLTRSLVESSGGCFGYIAEGTLTETVQNGQRLVINQRDFEGWRKVA